METPVTCPRGHAVAPDAVLCTVCWVRLDGEDPQSKRARILNVVSRPAGVAVVGGVVLATGIGAAFILANPSAPPAIVAGDSAVVIASPSATAAPSASSEQTADAAPSASSLPSAISSADEPLVTSVPLAATVVGPVTTGPDGTCLLDVLDQETACSAEGELVRFEVCVPAGTATVVVRTRSTPDDEWADVSSDVVLLPGDGCASDGQRADVALAAAGFDVTQSKWRLVGRDTSGDKLWKSKLRPAG